MGSPPWSCRCPEPREVARGTQDSSVLPLVHFAVSSLSTVRYRDDMTLPRLPFSGAHWVDSLARHAYSIPDEVAIRFEGSSLTWARFDDRVRRLAAAFADRGVRKGDRVVVLMTNRPEFVETTLAANALGGIAVPVNFRLTPDEVGYV